MYGINNKLEGFDDGTLLKGVSYDVVNDEKK